jgi:hypothetical protein
LLGVTEAAIAANMLIRNCAATGVTAEATLPDQVIKVYVRVNYGRTVRKMVGWGLLTVAGGALGAWGREQYQPALAALARVWWLLEKLGQ